MKSVDVYEVDLTLEQMRELLRGATIVCVYADADDGKSEVHVSFKRPSPQEAARISAETEALIRNHFRRQN